MKRISYYRPTVTDWKLLRQKKKQVNTKISIESTEGKTTNTSNSKP